MTVISSSRWGGRGKAPWRAVLLLLLLLPLSTGAVTLKIATLAPDGTLWMQAMRAAGERVEQQTDGRVKLRFYPGGVMGNDRSVLRKIRIGQLHGGAITAGGLEPVYPDIQLYSLPFAFDSYDEVDYVRRRMDPIIIAELRKRGLISFGLSETGFAYLMSQAPIKTLDQLREHRIWSPEGDAISRLAFKTLGVSTIPLPLTDVLTGLQTGLIDTVAGAPVGAIALQWHTRVRYLTDVPLIYLYGTLVIQERAFKRLSPADRKRVEEAFSVALDEVNREIRLDNEEAKEALRRQGIAFTAPDPSDLARWRLEIDRAVEAMSTEGRISPALLEEMQGLKRKFSGR